MREPLPLALAVILAACSQPFDEAGTAAGADPEPEELLPAYYLVQPQDLQGLPTNGVPAPDLTQFGLLVCNAGLDPADVRVAAPQATVFAYVSSHFVALWGAGNPIHDAWRAAFDSTAFWVDGQGQRTSTWVNTEELLYTAENGLTLAGLVLEHLGGWDGIYVDDCWANLSPTIYSQLPVPQADWPLVEQDWDAFRESFLLTLRAGTPQLIVGNSGSSAVELRHVGLDGFACEEWVPSERPIVLEEFKRYDPRYCVTWEWEALPLARAGDIRYR
jgi:hypothetical protein